VYSVVTQVLFSAFNMSSTLIDDPSHSLIFIRATDGFQEDGCEFASEFVAKLVYEWLMKVPVYTKQFHVWLQLASCSPKVSGLFASMFRLVSVDIIAQGGTFKTMDMVPGEYKEETFPVREVKFCSSLPEVLTAGVLLRAYLPLHPLAIAEHACKSPNQSFPYTHSSPSNCFGTFAIRFGKFINYCDTFVQFLK
jgi:hypothetical protein